MEGIGQGALRGLSLLRKDAYVGGKWLPAASGKTFNVINPANEKVIGSVPDMDEQDCKVAINFADEAFQSWKRKTAKERAGHLRKWFSLIEENKQDLAAIMTAEAGKPLAESIGEIAYGSSFIEWFAEEARRIYGEVVQSPVSGREMIFLRQPVGVAGLITPWNFPSAMITRKAGAALAAGCTCVVKPAEDTPLSALALGHLADEAGLPPGVFNVVTSSRRNAAAVGQALCRSTKVGALSFTGSTAVGKLLYEQCASTVKKVGLELGGNAPFIVFNSARLDTALNAIMVAKFRNCGQTCISANRIFVQSDIYDEFLTGLKDRVRALVVGDGAHSGVTIGPLINKSQLNKVDTIVHESVKQGATLVIGGKGHSLGGLFYEPTILTDVHPNMRCFAEEIFGPVVALRKFDVEEEAVKLANDSSTGLAAYFFSQDVSQVWRVSRELESGMVAVNEGLMTAAEAAFGGMKESGIGREGSKYGIDDYTDIKYICFGGINVK